MKKDVNILIIVFLSLTGCKAQEVIRYTDLKYNGYAFTETFNKSFINKRILFSKGSDSIFFNLKISFDIAKKEVVDPGLFYSCGLKKDSLYNFELKKINSSQIPDEYNSYYKINAIFTSKTSSRFSEIKKNTEYKYQGHTGRFIDINNELFIIEKIKPAGDCIFQL